jgi:dTMP kinase
MFITLEGPEGSGKTSHLPDLADFLREDGWNVLTTREPGGTAIGDQVRQVLMRNDNTAMNPRAETLLFLAARAQLVNEVIRPALAAGTVVISDRYGDSTLAYQGYGHGNDLDTIRQMLAFATGGLTPDLTVLLDVDPAVGLRRKKSVGEWNRMDAYQLEFHQRVRAGYLELARQEPRRWVVLDAGLPREMVQSALRQVILARLTPPTV